MDVPDADLRKAHRHVLFFPFRGPIADCIMIPATKIQAPALSRLPGAEHALGGIVGDRLGANEAHWLLTAPDANPGMLQMFRDRDRQPVRDLVPWAGEFAGKYLTSGVLCLRLTGSAALRTHLARFVADLSPPRTTTAIWARSRARIA